MKILFTFPGQGTQRAGMLQHLPDGAPLFGVDPGRLGRSSSILTIGLRQQRGHGIAPSPCS